MLSDLTEKNLNVSVCFSNIKKNKKNNCRLRSTQSNNSSLIAPSLERENLDLGQETIKMEPDIDQFAKSLRVI